MNDLRVVHRKGVLEVRRTTFLSLDPPVLQVEGVDLIKADEVRLNDFPAPDFEVVGRNRLEVDVPDNLVDQPITSILVLSARAAGRGSMLFYRISPQSTSAPVASGAHWGGVDRMVQRFVKRFMSNIGSYPDFSRGGGIRAQIGANVRATDGSDLRAQISMAIERTARWLREVQGRNPTLTPEEKLVSATMTNVEFNQELGFAGATVILTNEAGTSASVSTEVQ